eukprot:6217971-Amphidinium_carterae.1
MKDHDSCGRSTTESCGEGAKKCDAVCKALRDEMPDGTCFASSGVRTHSNCLEKIRHGFELHGNTREARCSAATFFGDTCGSGMSLEDVPIRSRGSCAVV